MSAARDLRADRLALGGDAILSVAEAARLLPWRDRDAREWLEREGLIMRRPGLPAPVVRWGDVVEAVRLGAISEPGKRPTGTLPACKKLK